MKKYGIVLIILIFGIFITGCNNESDNTKVVVYSPHGAGERGEFITRRAKEDLNLDIEFLSAGGGALADRLSAEKNNPQADVVLALNQLFLHRLKDEGVLEKFEPKWAKEIDSKYRDEDGYFYGFGRSPIVIAYNTAFLNKATAPKSWLDLVKPDYRNKYEISSLGNQTTRMYIAGMLWRFYDKNKGDISEEGWQFLRQLYRNARYVGQQSLDWAEVKNGKMPIVLDWYGGVVRDAKNHGVDMAFVETSGGTPIVAESIALIKGGSNSENAKKFIEWFGSAEFMAEYAEEFFHFGQVPLNKRAIDLVNVEIRKASQLFEEQDMDLRIISEKLNNWLKKIELEIMP